MGMAKYSGIIILYIRLFYFNTFYTPNTHIVVHDRPRFKVIIKFYIVGMQFVINIDVINSRMEKKKRQIIIDDDIIDYTIFLF